MVVGAAVMWKEHDLVAREVACYYLWEEMEEVKLKYRENIATQIRRLFKTEFHCDGNNEDGLEVVTKEVPCSATELAK